MTRPSDPPGPAARPEAAGPAEAPEGAALPGPGDAPAAGGAARFRLAVPRIGRPRLPSTRRGIFALVLVLGGLFGVAAFGSVTLIHWTETADFCGRCHTMAPELAAYDAGPHRDVACAECHVAPGVQGFIQSKINGTRQLAEVVLGTFPEPIPPPDHADLPDPSVTCARCHSVEREALAALRTRTRFAEDEANTRQFVGLMVRPAGGDVFDVERSVHWHVLRKVVFRTPDEDTQSIDYVAAEAPDGTIREYIAQDKIRVAQDVEPDIERLKAAQPERVMSCYDCHNRVGHPIPNPRTSVDYDLSTGAIDPSLPFVKREAMRVLLASYPDEASADADAERLRSFYEVEYPTVYKLKSVQINRAIDRVKLLYRLTATPEMKVTARTYPDNLGHTDFPGCFRCHDGGHFLVENGAVTTKAIPSSCDTCHTFPQLGPAVASLPLGEPPSTHDQPLYVFNHKSVATSLDPGSQSCGECHARDYCVNCHSTGAVSVDHDEMLTNHAKVIRETGNQACAYCHQPVYCARCHREPVLPEGRPLGEATNSSGPPAGALATGQPPQRWPLAITGQAAR